MKKNVLRKSDHLLYGTWWNMIIRCYSKGCSSFKWYGAKGVTVCDRWRNNFFDFVEDVGPRPEGYTLDRIDPFGNYTPENCRWANNKTQGENKRNALRRKNLTVDIGRGQESVLDLCKKLGLNTCTVLGKARKQGVDVTAFFLIRAWYRQKYWSDYGGASGYLECDELARNWLTSKGIKT